MASPPTIDGAVDESEWKDAFRSEGFTDPVTGQLTADKSEIWIGSDKKAIYVAFRLTDSQPGRIQARSTQEGSDTDGEDVVAFEIDPLNRRSWETSAFIVNPLGASREQIAGGRSSKKEWRGLWKSKARLTATGWEAEMMIPWKMLNLPPDRIASMQINFIRYQARTNTKSLWSDTTVRELPEKSGIWSKVEVPTLPIEISLQGYATPEVDEDNDPRFTFRAGLDARARFTPTINGLASLNPDFKNIEQDIAGIDFTRSERFRDDARPFFQEGSGYFSLTSRHTFGRMFYSNRIDDFDQGVKAFGDIDRRNSFGVLAAREDGRRTDVVANFDHKFDFRNLASAYVTSRQTPGGRSTASGVNLNLSNGMWGAGGNLAFNQGQGLENSRANSAYLEYSIPNFFAIVRHMDVEKDFDPALGFVPFKDRHGAYLYSEYNRELRKGPVRYFGGDFGIDYFEKGNGSNLFKGAYGGFRFTTRSDVMVNLRYNSELFEDQLEETGMVSMIFNASNSQRQFGFLVSSGQRAGEATTFTNVFARARVLKRLDLSISRDELKYLGFLSQTVLTAAWEIDRFQSFTARAVNRDGKTGWYMAYRKSGNKGLEYYAILGDPNSPEFRQRLAFKVIWAQ